MANRRGGGFDASHTAGVARWPNIECRSDWRTKDTTARQSGMDGMQMGNGRPIETRLSLKYVEIQRSTAANTKERSGTQNPENMIANTNTETRKSHQYHSTRDSLRGKWYPVLF